MNRSLVGAVAAVVVGLVLLLAGVSKLARPAEWRAQSAGLGVRWGMAKLVPILEVGLGGVLLVQLQRHLFAWFAVALFGMFTVLLLIRIAQGRRPPCACFGSLSSRPIGPGHLARNALFISLAVAAALL